MASSIANFQEFLHLDCIPTILSKHFDRDLMGTLVWVHLSMTDFSNAFDSIHRGKMEQILLAYGLSKETVTAIIKSRFAHQMGTQTSLTLLLVFCKEMY